MWDDTSAEVQQLKRQCEKMLEDSEEDIEKWYYNYQNEDKLHRNGAFLIYML